MKVGWSIRQVKKFDLIFEMAIPSLECHLYFIVFLNPYPMVYIGQIKLGKMLDITQPIQKLDN